MKTQKPLRSLVPDIILEFERYREQIQFDLDLYEMHEGQVRKFVEDSLKSELISKSAYNRAVQRIPSINIPRKVTDKLSKVYAEAPIRFSEKDNELIEDFSHLMQVNGEMQYANQMSNLNKRCALEIYTEDSKQKIRVLTAHQFFVYSDSPTSPDKPTVFVKLLGTEEKRRDTISTREGRRVTNEDDIILVQIFALYSDDEFLIVDSDGAIREDKMRDMGITSSRNPFGVIPFIYINKSKTELMPYPNQTAYDMGILIPKLLTDLNYSAQFLSHSVIWVRNADMEGQEINPDAIVNLGDADQDGNTPDMGTIDPRTDIDGVLKLIQFELGSYMSTEGLKAGSVGQIEASSAASGISKIMDESDATEARKQQTELFRQAERELWYKFSKMQAIWSRVGAVEKKDNFSPDFIESFSIKFADIKPLESEKQKYEKMKIARDLKLITKKQALKELYPNLPEDQLDARLKELEEELKKEKDEMMSMGLTPSFTQLDQQQEGGAQTKAMNKEDNAGSKSE